MIPDVALHLPTARSREDFQAPDVQHERETTKLLLICVIRQVYHLRLLFFLRSVLGRPKVGTTPLSCVWVASVVVAGSSCTRGSAVLSTPQFLRG